MNHAGPVELTADEKKMQEKLLKEERAMKAKQPRRWTDSKYRFWGEYQSIKGRAKKKMKRKLTPAETRRAWNKAMARVK